MPPMGMMPHADAGHGEEHEENNEEDVKDDEGQE